MATLKTTIRTPSVVRTIVRGMGRPGTGGSSLIVREVDGAPSGTVTTLTFPNGTVAIAGNEATITGLQGPQGPAGPNTVSTSTSTNINGWLRGNGSTVEAATVSANSLLGNNTGSAASPASLSATQVRALLGLATTSDVEFNALTITETNPNVTPFSLTGYSLTSNNAQSLLSLSGTWNTTGTPTAIDLNITDTASNAASLLMNLRTGGTSRFSVRKDGFLSCAGPISAGSNSIFMADNSIHIAQGGNLNIRDIGAVRWSSTPNSFSSVDLILLRDAANILAQRNGTNAQISRIYKTFTSATNFETYEVDASSDASNYRIGHRTGSVNNTVRGLQFGRYDGAGAWTSWLGIDTSGNVIISGFGDFSGTVFANGGNGVRITNRIHLTSPSSGVLTITDQNFTTLSRINLGGSTSSFPSIKRNGTTAEIRLGDDSAFAPLSCSNLTASGSQITLSGLPTTNPGVAGRLWNDAGTLRIS